MCVWNQKYLCRLCVYRLAYVEADVGVLCMCRERRKYLVICGDRHKSLCMCMCGDT